MFRFVVIIVIVIVVVVVVFVVVITIAGDINNKPNLTYSSSQARTIDCDNQKRSNSILTTITGRLLFVVLVLVLVVILVLVPVAFVNNIST